jgi:hypothetical protein
MDRRRRRAQDQADPALGQGTALDRHPARHPGVPLRAAAAGVRAPQDRAVHQRAGEGGHLGAGCRRHLQDPAVAAQPGPRRHRRGAPAAAAEAPRAGPVGLAGSGRRQPEPGRRGHRGGGGQVRRPPGRLQVARRGAEARGLRTAHQGADEVARVRGDREAGHRRARGRRRDPGAGRLRRPRHRGQDAAVALRPRERRAVSRHLLRHAGGGRRFRPQRGRPGRRQQHRERSPPRIR